MTVTDDLAAAVELACLTEDRTDAEQDALLRVAARVDARMNALVSTNPRVRSGPRYVTTGPASRLYELVHETRTVVDDQTERYDRKVAARLAKQAARWNEHRS